MSLFDVLALLAALAAHLAGPAGAAGLLLFSHWRLIRADGS